MTTAATTRRDAKYYAERIAGCWQKCVSGIIQTGQEIAVARGELAHGEFGKMCEAMLPFGRETAFKLMSIASDGRLLNVARGQHLPPSWRTLYEIHQLPDKTFKRAISDGIIHPGVHRREITALRMSLPGPAPKAKRGRLKGGLRPTQVLRLLVTVDRVHEKHSAQIQKLPDEERRVRILKHLQAAKHEIQLYRDSVRRMN